MKTPCPASRVLSFLVLSLGIAAASPLLAQGVSHTFNQPPPPGYPAAGTGLKQPSTRATRQSAAAIQVPVTQYPPTYPPPAGYTYPPPGYGLPPKGAAPKTAATKPGSKTTSAKKSPTPPPAPPQPKVYGPTGDLTNQVTKLRESDKVQNIRIGELERDVSSIKRGGKGTTRYDGGSDLAAHTTYIARPGDTLWRIASTHRVSVGEIQQLNRMTEEEVRVGQALLIPSPHRLDPPTTQVNYTPSTPGGHAGPASAPVTTTRVVTSPLYYTVKKGDSLKAIALKHKITAVTLASANKIKDVNKITIGQRLKIPGRTTTVTVASKSPAPRPEYPDTVPLPGYGVPGAPPPPAAGLGMAPPPPMQQPPPQPAPPPAAPKGPDLSDSHRGILAYRVDRSDTIETIATQFTTTPDHIREMNRLAPGSVLKAGDEIMVPAMGAVSVSNR
ncbi:LysM peptidoglycan-binding domain-containing protein [Prosthecobacter sp.]|uniref:muramidase family protein n=1 Tax=Prosthecobacter sp. TaxID=1965333 RepID=UPI0037834DA8